MNVSIEALNDLNSDVKISGMSLTTAGPLVVDFFSTQVCAGDSTVLTSSSSPADSIQSLLWDLDGDGKFDDAEGSVVTHLFKGAGLYGVGLKGITYHGKTKAIYKEVIVAGVKVDFSVDNGCTGMNSDFRDNSTLIGDFPVAYFWDFGDGTPGSDLTNPTHTYNSQGSYPVKHRVRTMGGCSDSITKMVLIAAPPLLELTFTGDTIFAEGDSVIASVSGDYDKVVWSDSSKGSWIVIRTSGKWWVRGYKNKCYSEESFSTLEKEYGPEPVAMTVFTPNNDGFNDVWKILNISKIGPCEVEIYDRWGIKVYSSKDYNNNWDGSYNGNRLGNDTYYFFIHTTDGHLYKGTVSIVK
jgi:gliding motility-associated-like protein